MKLVVIGGGRMGGALIRGLISSGWASPSELGVVEISEAQRDRLEGGHHGLATFRQYDTGMSNDVVLAVKPQDVEMTCLGLADKSIRRVLSVVAGVTTATLESTLDPGTIVVRSMPNIPALVGHSAAGITRGTLATLEDLDWASGVLHSVGKAVEVPEDLMDAVTGLSGSGPAYFFLVVEALVEAGIRVGLDRETAIVLARQTFIGAARLLEETGESAEDLRIAVTSPAGTTAAGIAKLDELKTRESFIAAVISATQRSKELGEQS